MKSECPERAEWLSLLDGEATENRASVLREHASRCPACARELDVQRQLIADLSAPTQLAPGAVDAIMRQLPQAPPVTSRSWRKRTIWVATGGAMVLAAAAGILLLPRHTTELGTFHARGGGKVVWSQKVGAEVFVLGPPLLKLESGSRVAPGVAMVVSYHNVDTVPAYLMVLGRDARGEWHWLYPGFEDPKSDPSSVPLEPLQMRRALPDSVVLDDLPAGELEIITLITQKPLRVSRLENLAKAERTVTALQTRFTPARITSLSLQVVTAPPVGKDTP